MRKNTKILKMTQFAILLAIEAIVCFTPLGSIPLGPLNIVATLMMIPVCITAILLGPKMGTLMGFCAGLFSFIVWTFMPPNPAFAFVFTPLYTLGEFTGNFGSLLICFVPRILSGTVTGLIYKAMIQRNDKRRVLSFSVSAALGSLVNTFGVMGGIWLFFGDQYAALIGKAILVIVGTAILTNGIAEAVIAAIAAPAVCKPVSVIFERSVPSDER